jgi:hypothetical protein
LFWLITASPRLLPNEKNPEFGYFMESKVSMMDGLAGTFCICGNINYKSEVVEVKTDIKMLFAGKY